MLIGNQGPLQWPWSATSRLPCTCVRSVMTWHGNNMTTSYLIIWNQQLNSEFKDFIVMCKSSLIRPYTNVTCIMGLAVSPVPLSFLLMQDWRVFSRNSQGRIAFFRSVSGQDFLGLRHLFLNFKNVLILPSIYKMKNQWLHIFCYTSRVRCVVMKPGGKRLLEIILRAHLISLPYN